MRTGIFRNSIMVICLCLVASTIAAQEPPVIPDTPAGKILSKFMVSYNSGDEAKWKEFINESWKESDREGALERRLGMFSQVYADLDKVELYRIIRSSDYEITVLLHSNTGTGESEWTEMTFYIDTEPPHQMTSASIRPGEDPKYDIPDKKLNDKEMVEFLDKYVGDMIAQDRFSGTILIAKDGVPFYTRAYGEACKRYDAPNKLDTKFNLGSMNKMFTGVAIMQLVEQGKIALEDKVGKYLPDCPNKEIADKVTIHQLLTHTSGMQDYWEEMFDAKWWLIKTVDQMGELVFDDSLLFEPGSDFHYSNSGPIVLGMIIEKVTGQDYFDYIREHVYKPAGMINSDCYEVDRPVPNLAIGYTYANYDGMFDQEGGLHNNLFMHVVRGGPAGGGYSTVEDLLNFDIALRNNKLMSRESFDLMSTGKVERRPGNMYAYLIQDKDVNGQRVVGHGGGAPGINAALDMYMDSGYTVAVMSNYDMAANTVARKIGELLTK